YMLWALLGLGAALLVAVMLYANNSEAEIKYSELMELVRRTDPAKPGRAFIDIHSEDRQRDVRLSELNNVNIGTWEITATVTREVNPLKAETDAAGKSQHRPPEANVAVR